MAQTKKALSGIKPTHSLAHLGNYFGMIKPAIELQKTHLTNYFIADYHALTTIRDAKQLESNVHDIAAQFLAYGLNPSVGALYRQSDVPEVCELSWLLSCAVSMGDLFRAHAFKAAKDEGKEGELNLGTFSYPVLMAADILLSDADVVPVGKDQLQHLEMARAIAKRFNFHFGETFKEPEALINESVAVVPGTDGRKMSKSYGNGIDPLAPEKELKKQVMAIVSDSKGLEDVKDPSTCNILAIYRLFSTGPDLQEIEAKYRAGGYGYGHAKQALLQKILEVFAEPRKRYEDLKKDPSLVRAVLDDGAKKMRLEARQLMSRARERCGLGALL